jgi:hypothetical protein
MARWLPNNGGTLSSRPLRASRDRFGDTGREQTRRDNAAES